MFGFARKIGLRTPKPLNVGNQPVKWGWTTNQSETTSNENLFYVAESPSGNAGFPTGQQDGADYVSWEIPQGTGTIELFMIGRGGQGGTFEFASTPNDLICGSVASPCDCCDCVCCGCNSGPNGCFDVCGGILPDYDECGCGEETANTYCCAKTSPIIGGGGDGGDGYYSSFNHILIDFTQSDLWDVVPSRKYVLNAEVFNRTYSDIPETTVLGDRPLAVSISIRSETLDGTSSQQVELIYIRQSEPSDNYDSDAAIPATTYMSCGPSPLDTCSGTVWVCQNGVVTSGLGASTIAQHLSTWPGTVTVPPTVTITSYTEQSDLESSQSDGGTFDTLFGWNLLESDITYGWAGDGQHLTTHAISGVIGPCALDYAGVRAGKEFVGIYVDRQEEIQRLIGNQVGGKIPGTGGVTLGGQND